MSDLLSQEEVHALLDGVSSGEVNTSVGVVNPSAEVMDYDLMAQERVTRGRHPSLEIINQRFSRSLEVGLYQLLRRSVQISVEQPAMIRFSEYVSTLDNPTSVNIVQVPQLEGTILLVLSADFVCSYVDAYFGGQGKLQNAREEPEFTPTELRVVHRLLTQVFTDLSSAWEMIAELDFEYLRSESNPSFVNVVGLREVVLVNRFGIQLDEGGGGNLDVTIPYSLLEPLREALDSGMQSDHTEKPERGYAPLQQRLQTVELELYTVLAESKISLNDLLHLRPGDIIPIDIPHTVRMYANSVPVLEGRFGVSRNRYAVAISRRASLDAGNIS